MIIAKIILSIALIFAALSLICAVTVGRRAPRQSGHFGGPSSQAKWADSAPADAYSRPFGDVPPFPPEQLRRMAPRRALYSETYETPSAGLALRPDAGSVETFPTCPDAARRDPKEVFESSWWRPRG
jgi:hypothetical protein